MIMMHDALHGLVRGDFKQKTPSSPRVVLILCILGKEEGVVTGMGFYPSVPVIVLRY